MFKTRFFSMLVLLMTAVTGAWATITVTWNNDDITFTGDDTSFTKDGVTITAGAIHFSEKNFTEGGTFTTTLGNFTKIEVTTSYWDASGTGWSGSTWTGNASSVSFSGSIWGEGMGNTKFVFTIEPATVAVTGVTLAPTSATLTLGETETVTLIPTVLPAEATDKSVTWSSSNEAVATVADGVVTAVGAGTATITATATNGTADTSDDFSATCEVTVSPAGYSVALKDGTEDATNWQGKAGEGEYQALPLTGLEAGTAVSVKYSGTKKVKSVKAKKKAAAAKTLAEATAEDLGKVVGADGNIYDDAAAATAASTTAVAVIAYVGSETYDATFKNGLAIALADEGSKNWSTAESTCEGKTAITGAKWCLPSQGQWKQMFKANGGNEGSYTGLNNALAAAGGDSSKLLEYEGYWSSSSVNGDYVWIVIIDEGGPLWDYGGKDNDKFPVRACLAF